MKMLRSSPFNRLFDGRKKEQQTKCKGEKRALSRVLAKEEDAADE